MKTEKKNGIYWSKRWESFIAHPVFGDEKIFLGKFSSMEEAEKQVEKWKQTRQKVCAVLKKCLPILEFHVFRKKRRKA